MRFDYDGQTYRLAFPRRDVPILGAHKRGQLLETPPLRRETSAVLYVLQSPVLDADSMVNAKLPPVVIGKATVRRYHKDPPLSNEGVRRLALDRLLPFLSEPLRNPTLQAYYGRPRGKSERKKHERRQTMAKAEP